LEESVIKLYFAPRTRAVRVVWLLEELGLPYELERAEFVPPAVDFFSQSTPLGKFPTLVDGDLVMCESGAIIEYILERYGDGRLAPPIGSPARPLYLQWLHFAESTAFPPLGIIVWLTRYRGEAESQKTLLEDARKRAASGFEFLERSLRDGEYVVGATFTAADIMLGFTLVAGQALGVLDDRFPKTNAYLARLVERPAFQRAAALE
jgi:glutathione S-transferase